MSKTNEIKNLTINTKNATMGLFSIILLVFGLYLLILAFNILVLDNSCYNLRLTLEMANNCIDMNREVGLTRFVIGSISSTLGIFLAVLTKKSVEAARE